MLCHSKTAPKRQGSKSCCLVWHFFCPRKKNTTCVVCWLIWYILKLYTCEHRMEIEIPDRPHAPFGLEKKKYLWKERERCRQLPTSFTFSFSFIQPKYKRVGFTVKRLKPPKQKFFSYYPPPSYSPKIYNITFSSDSHHHHPTTILSFFLSLQITTSLPPSH